MEEGFRERGTGDWRVKSSGAWRASRPMSMAEPVRLRVVFGDAGLLKQSQRRRGLQRCLLQLRPDVATIADLAAQLHQTFGLHRSCPHGLIISMDDFVLPPFETTSILKDDDMIIINKNGVVFKDAVKFCGNQYQEQVLQSQNLAYSNRKLAIMDEIIDPIVAYKGDEDDMVLCNGNAVRVKAPQSEKMNARCKRKHSTKLQSSDNILASKDSHGDSVGDEEHISLHGNIKHKGATSNEMVNANCKKKHTNKFQASGSTLENKDSQADSQADKGHLTLPVRHKKNSSGEMIQGKQNKKHFDKLQGSDGTLTIEDSQGYLQGDEYDDGLLGIIAHKDATSNEMMILKHKRKCLNKFQALNTLTSKISHGESQVDEEDLGLSYEKKSQEESPECEMSNTKRKKKHSHRHQGSKSEVPTETPSEITDVFKKIHSNKQGASDGTLTIEDSQGNSQRDEHDDGLLGIIAHKEVTSNEMMDSKHKRKRLSKLLASKLTSKNCQRDSQDDEEDLGPPNEKKSQEESPQCEMANPKRKKIHSHRHQGSKVMDLPNRSEAPTEIPSEITNVFRRIHSNKQKTSDGTLTIEDSQGKSQRDEHDGLFGIIAHKEATSNEMMNSKPKRKHHNKLKASNMLTSKNSQVDSQGDEVDLGLPSEKKSQEESPQCQIANTKRKRKRSHRHRGAKSEAPTETPSEITNVVKRIHSNKQKTSENEFKGIHDGHASMNGANGDEWKMNSRSARRKKAKKIFYRLKKQMADNKEVDHSSQNLSMPISHNLVDNQEKPSDCANADQNTDMNIDIVPVIVRPGHIRFESSDEPIVREDDQVNTFQWNGITSKKKGQKWGMEKSYNNWNDDTFNQLFNGESDVKEVEVIEVSNENAAVEEVESHKNSIAEEVQPVIECDKNSISEELEAQKKLTNYESFLPLTRLPEEGDLLVYHVVELSSSWCPELSPFRVGRVSLYDPSSSKIILLPLPEYPLISEETPDEGQESVSLYEEDGTLEIDFSSLVDVRLFKSPESEETTPNFLIEETTPNFPIEETTPNFPIEETIPNCPMEETTPKCPIDETTPNFPIEETQNDAPVHNQESEACSDHTENEQHVGDAWDAIKLALDEKKAELEEQNKFDKRRDSSGSAEAGRWSYKALRRNAVGPTLAMLRRSSSGD